MKNFTSLTILWFSILFASSQANAQSIAFSPNNGLSGTSFDVTVTGTGTSWASSTSHCVELTDGTTTFSFVGSVASTTTDILTGIVDIPIGANGGNYSASVYDNDSGNCTGVTDGNCNGCFTVTNPIPTISISADNGKQGDAFMVSVSGTNTSWASNTNHCVELTNGATTLSFIGTVSNNNNRIIIGIIDIPTNATIGNYDAVVYDSDAGDCSSTTDGSCSDCFSVIANTASISFSPNSGNSGDSFTVTVTGTNTSWASSASQCVELTNGITTFNFFANVSSDTMNFLTGTINIPLDASAGDYDAKVFDSQVGNCSGISDGLCSGCFTISILEPSISNSPVTALQGETVDMTVNGTDISWIDGSTHCVEITNGLNTLTFEAGVVTGMNSTLSGSFSIPVAFQTGDYDVNVYQENSGVCNGVIDVTCVDCFNISTLVSTNELDASIRVYPNPVDDRLFIEYSEMSSATSLQIYDVLGRLVHEQQVGNKYLGKVIPINTSALDDGLYMLMIVDENQKQVFEFIKSD